MGKQNCGSDTEDLPLHANEERDDKNNCKSEVPGNVPLWLIDQP